MFVAGSFSHATLGGEPVHQRFGQLIELGLAGSQHQAVLYALRAVAMLVIGMTSAQTDEPRAATASS
jgi:hypothetical protein